MSRSRKSVSIPTINAGSMKWFKRRVNKGLRSRTKQLIGSCNDYDSLVLPLQDDIATLYDSPKDGLGVWYWKPYYWWTEERTEAYYRNYLKGFRK